MAKAAGKSTGLEYVKKSIGSLTANPRNARTHNKAQIKKIVSSIKEFGFISPLIIDKEGVLIAGHGRLQAAKQIGMKEIPCIIADHLTDAQIRAYMLADNRIALDSGWDDDLLKIELNELSKLGFDLNVTGFDTYEVGGFIRKVGETDKEAEWKEGMPEFSDAEPAYQKIVVSFDDAESVKKFSELIGADITEKTKSVWYPPKERRETKGKKWK